MKIPPGVIKAVKKAVKEYGPKVVDVGLDLLSREAKKKIKRKIRKGR